MLGFSIRLTSAVAQEGTVKDVPEEIRKLPNSFKEEYRGSAYDYVESVSWLDKIKAWLLDKLDSWFSVNSERGSNILSNLETLFYILVILGVVYIIVRMILNKEGRWLFSRKREETEELNYEIGEDIHEVNFEVLIKEALQNKDYRLAVRYNYLLLLKKLDEFSVISYDSQKTTYDYSLDLEGTSYSTGFNKATYYYTYIWYGEFTIDEEEYKTASLVYAQILKSFKNA
ncbi:hypothetical protein [uncultured Maribacter sp.]|uniref:hypothetical protein n=1 Tax=uncultured Maribacter sp. TaxID=431308 RepID=UPI0026188958|nr:hypothetical protein [uncultured Maribacter sp.]